MSLSLFSVGHEREVGQRNPSHYVVTPALTALTSHRLGSLPLETPADNLPVAITRGVISTRQIRDPTGF